MKVMDVRRVSFTCLIDPDVYDMVDELVKDRRFRSKSRLVEEALKKYLDSEFPGWRSLVRHKNR